jgi:hypothetical protein
MNAPKSSTLFALAMLSLAVACAKENESATLPSPIASLGSQDDYLGSSRAVNPLQWDWSDTDPPTRTGGR